MMTKLVIILLSSQAEFTLSSKLNLMYVQLPQQKDCFEAIYNVREDIAIFDNQSNKWLLKDGTQFIGGFCE